MSELSYLRVMVERAKGKGEDRENSKGANHRKKTMPPQGYVAV